MAEIMTTNLRVLPRLDLNACPGPVVVAGILGFVLALMFYRRYVAPLRDVPGPFWASVGRLWHTRMIMRGNQGEDLLELHEKYGTHFCTHTGSSAPLLMSKLKAILYVSQTMRSAYAIRTLSKSSS